MSFSTVGVVGCGLMGAGIAEVCARAGCDVLVLEADATLLARGLERISSSLARAVEKGKTTDADRRAALGRLRGVADVRDLKDCDLVIEAVVEKVEAKKEVFRALDAVVRSDTVLATNTSSLSVTEIAAVCHLPDRVLGIHFFNPVPVMKLVELVVPEETRPDVVAAARAFAERLGKQVIASKDRPGFIVNLLLVPFLLDAVRAVEQGTATPEDVDTGMTLGCNHPMGPIRLLDYVGLDTTLFIADYMYDQYKDARYAAPPLLRRLVSAGRTGRKSGRGFYNWTTC